MDAEITFDHIRQFVELWIQLRDENLQDDMCDEIKWNLTKSGQYTAKSAYKAQFFGATSSPTCSLVWKIWAPPKIKSFALLTIQNRLWTNDHLQKRGWRNGGACPLCKRVPESAGQLFIHCRCTHEALGPS
jgi:hypothetical protein